MFAHPNTVKFSMHSGHYKSTSACLSVQSLSISFPVTLPFPPLPSHSCSLPYSTYLPSYSPPSHPHPVHSHHSFSPSNALLCLSSPLLFLFSFTSPVLLLLSSLLPLPFHSPLHPL